MGTLLQKDTVQASSTTAASMLLWQDLVMAFAADILYTKAPQAVHGNTFWAEQLRCLKRLMQLDSFEALEGRA